MTTKFMIGADEWPGISKLIEECGEVAQVCGKLIATQGETAHWDGTDLKQRLVCELSDLLAAISFVGVHCKLDLGAIEARMEAKLALFEHWQKEQQR